MPSTSNRQLLKARKPSGTNFIPAGMEIENEMPYYAQFFKDKILYFNCDDPEHSNFYKYFKDNYLKYRYKRIMATCLNKKSVVVYDGVRERKLPLRAKGDFKSKDCVSLLQQADVIITNPPFSLFKEVHGIVIAV